MIYTCSAEKYVNGENDLAVCVDLDDQKWEENFIDNLVQEEIADTTEENLMWMKNLIYISPFSQNIEQQRGNTII